MTREIKFRGKRIDNGEWMYGDLIANSAASMPRIKPMFIDCNTSTDTKVIAPNTIGQFTGLLDKNGKDIYEGDIIIEKLRRARKDGERLVICFDDFEWQGKNANGATSLSLLVEYHTIEIIGNIHDNPELQNGENLILDT